MTRDFTTKTGPHGDEAPSAFEKFARMIARRDVLSEFRFLPASSKLYMVETGWKSFMIKDDPKVVEVLSLSEFEDAVRNPDVHMIYVPVAAPISMEGIKRVCQRNAATKAIIKEVKKDD